MATSIRRYSLFGRSRSLLSKTSPRPFLAGLAAGLVLLPVVAPSQVVERPGAGSPDRIGTSHAGELLVATPRMRDPRFRKTVILLVRHSRKGAFGLVLNRVVGKVKLARLLKGLDLKAPEDVGEINVHYGGPVDPESGFVVHSLEREAKPGFRVSETVGVSPVNAILRAIALGEGPRRIVFAVGYAGWGPGQLDAEMRRGDWYTAPADQDILFDEKQNTKWKRAVERRFQTL